MSAPVGPRRGVRGQAAGATDPVRGVAFIRLGTSRMKATMSWPAPYARPGADAAGLYPMGTLRVAGQAAMLSSRDPGSGRTATRGSLSAPRACVWPTPLHNSAWTDTRTPSTPGKCGRGFPRGELVRGMHCAAVGALSRTGRTRRPPSRLVPPACGVQTGRGDREAACLRPRTARSRPPPKPRSPTALQARWIPSWTPVPGATAPRNRSRHRAREGRLASSARS